MSDPVADSVALTSEQENPPVTSTDTGATTSEQQQARKEGLAHIHNKLTEKLEAAKIDDSTTPAPVTAPPASNPGADDPTGGLAPTAGGVSGAADKDIPNPAVATPTSEKRKSIFGNLKGLFGNDKKKNSTAASTSEETYLGAATVAVASTAAVVTETVQSYTTGGDKKEEGKAAAADTTDGTTDTAAQKSAEAEASTVAPADASAAATTTDEPAAEAETVAKDGAAKQEEEPAAATESSKEKSAHAPGSIPGLGATEDKDISTHRTNPDAIPVAGGVKVGEEHFGESTILPEDPGVQPIEGQGAAAELMAKATGQPLESEVANNTAANTGSATAGPDATSSDAAANATAADEKQPKEKGKFLSKLKAKLSVKKNKE